MQFTAPQTAILQSSQDFNLFLSGIGSGKTHLAGAISGYYLTQHPDAWGFIAANTYQQLTTSTLYRIREVWADLFGWKEGIDYVVGIQPPKHFNTENHNFDNYNGIISMRWGAVAFKGSLERASVHDGKEFSWAILDETKDTREAAVKDVIIGRLRKGGIYRSNEGELSPIEKPGFTKFTPIYILTSPAKVQWLNEWFELETYEDEIHRCIYSETDFFQKDYKDKCVVISSTHHNPHVGKAYIEKILSNSSEEVGNRLIYGNPFVKTGGEFYSSFDRRLHIKDVPFLPDMAIHMSWDQNVKPYVTCTLYQIRKVDHKGERYTEVRQFDEICLGHPRNKTAKVCAEFIKRWGRHCVNGLFFYGDPSGRKRDTRSNEHDYQIIKRILRRYLNNRSNRVQRSAPSVPKRRDFVNALFEGQHNVRFMIDKKRCGESIKDFEFVKEDMNGRKLKEKVKDSDGVRYEKYGHTSDSFDYFICTILRPIYERHFK